MTTAVSEKRGSFRILAIRVDLPAPKKPVRRVTGIVLIGRCHTQLGGKTQEDVILYHQY
jgi:hypothetical protein